jgi:predicted dehydrogenase
MDSVRIAVIGLGERMIGLLTMLAQAHPEVNVKVVVDPMPADQLQPRLARAGASVAGVQHRTSVEEFVAAGADVDACMIGTRCSRHAPIAIELARTELPIYLEKPVATSWEQLSSLAEAFRGREKRVVVSFPLRVSPLFQQALAFAKSGVLGRINQIQAVNNVPYGGVYFAQWYRDYSETGGLWLQKATHDFDYIHELAGATPERITAMNHRDELADDLRREDACGTALLRLQRGRSLHRESFEHRAPWR